MPKGWELFALVELVGNEICVHVLSANAFWEVKDKFIRLWFPIPLCVLVQEVFDAGGCAGDFAHALRARHEYRYTGIPVFHKC